MRPRDQLQKYQFEKIFSGCRLLDIHEYLMEKGVRLQGVLGEDWLPRYVDRATHGGIERVLV